MQSQVMRLIAICLIFTSTQVCAQITARAQLSDIGAGAEIGYRWDNKWGLRLGHLLGELDLDFDADDTNGFQGDELTYESDVDLENSYLLADWHPWNRYFRVSTGLFLNNSKAKVVTRCEAQALIPGTESCEFGNSRFPAAILGDVTTKVDFDTVAPYLGIGWGHRPESGFAFNVDLGVIYLGTASVDMSSSGSCNSDDQCREQIESEEREIEKELEDYRFLPFAALGVSYLF